MEKEKVGRKDNGEWIGKRAENGRTCAREYLRVLCAALVPLYSCV